MHPNKLKGWWKSYITLKANWKVTSDSSLLRGGNFSYTITTPPKIAVAHKKNIFCVFFWRWTTAHERPIVPGQHRSLPNILPIDSVSSDNRSTSLTRYFLFWGVQLCRSIPNVSVFYINPTRLHFLASHGITLLNVVLRGWIHSGFQLKLPIAYI